MEDAQYEQLMGRLDVLIGLLQVAHAPQLEAAREDLLSDPVAKRLLEATEDWISAGSLAGAVANACGVSERTVQRTMAELLKRGILRNRRAARSLEYKTTGIL